MHHHRGRVVLVESLDDLDRRVAGGATSMAGWRVRGLDLGARSDVLGRLSTAGATFLGCRFAPGDAERAEAGGALVLPAIPRSPVDPYRATLYRPEELYDVPGDTPRYAGSLDARAYAWSQQGDGPDDTLARALHDHAIDEALAGWVSARRAAGRPVVGVMGGHALRRDEQAYAAAAGLGRRLGVRWTVATGGGPGAMEAANLGAHLSPYPQAALDEALPVLAGVPSYRPSVGAWAARAFEVRRRFPEGGETLGIPTWHYGHEPPNPFASAIAKYFRNATREATLLEVCDAGIVFLPGAGGTVQEVFQDACENYYADRTAVAPMVLVGTRYWTEELPAWPLLRALARGRAMEAHIHLVDTVEEVAPLLESVSPPSGGGRAPR